MSILKPICFADKKHMQSPICVTCVHAKECAQVAYSNSETFNKIKSVLADLGDHHDYQ